MKRILALFIAAALLTALPVKKNETLRLHIVANSDSAEDQRVKLEVRDALLEYERGIAPKDSADAEASLMADADGLIALANAVLEKNGMDYSARISVGEYDFPVRSYAGEIYPAGRYRALRVVLGEGKGRNWWCVMFPPLCILELPNGEIDYTELDKIEFDSYLIRLVKRIDGGRLWEIISEKLR